MRNQFTNAKYLKNELDKRVMGQSQGTRAVATAIAQHVLRYEMRFVEGYQRTVKKQCLLLGGPTGSGKTETIRYLEEALKSTEVPLVLENTLFYAPTDSWKGRPLSEIFYNLLDCSARIYFDNNGYDEPYDLQEMQILDAVEHGIVVLDEFDKISYSYASGNRAFQSDYQSNMLKIVEGITIEIGDYEYEATVPTADPETGELTYKKKRFSFNNISIDTTNIMFIFMGAYSGIERITRQRLTQEWNKTHKPKEADTYEEEPRWEYQQHQIGFMCSPRPANPVPAKTDTKPAKSVNEPTFTDEQMVPTADDIINYGVMRELVGRIPIITMYRPLSAKSLVNIMLNCETSALREFQLRISVMGHRLQWDSSALRVIAQRSIDRGTGARGLRTILSEILTEPIYELSGESEPHICVIRGKDIKLGKPPQLCKMKPKRSFCFEKELQEDIQKLKNETKRESA